jgi:hypothetical protein
MKDYERNIAQYQSLIENKDIALNELQQKFDKQTFDLQSIVCIIFFKVYDVIDFVIFSKRNICLI